LEPSHYNFPKLEKRHYYSRILKFAIAILDFPQIYHKIRMKTTRAQLQVYRRTYISLYLCYPLNDMRASLVIIFLFLPSSHLPSSSSSHVSVQGAGPATGVGRRGGVVRQRVQRAEMGGVAKELGTPVSRPSWWPRIRLQKMRGDGGATVALLLILLVAAGGAGIWGGSRRLRDRASPAGHPAVGIARPPHLPWSRQRRRLPGE
jgi:hypothetical protein